MMKIGDRFKGEFLTPALKTLSFTIDLDSDPSLR